MSEYFSIIISPYSLDFFGTKLPHLNISIIFFSSCSSLICCVKINFNHTVSPNFDLGDFLCATKKQPYASVNPANQFKSVIFLSSIFGIIAGVTLGKAEAKLSDNFKFIEACIDTIFSNPFFIRCSLTINNKKSLYL